tara:strand:+ start:42 stop:320 length:279 start_codon:yes stop_codon:yes gene_type:complete
LVRISGTLAFEISNQFKLGTGCRPSPSEVNSSAAGGFEIKSQAFTRKPNQSSFALNAIALSHKDRGKTVEIGEGCGQDGQMGHGLNARFVKH